MFTLIHSSMAFSLLLVGMAMGASLIAGVTIATYNRIKTQTKTQTKEDHHVAFHN